MSDPVTRFSVSVAGSLLDGLDALVRSRGLPSRSHAVGEMIRHYLLEHPPGGDQIVAGVITLVYTNDRSRLRGELQDVQHRYLKEVISSQHVFLEGDQSLEALLVQGPERVLRALVSELASRRGVHTVKLAVSAGLLPPLHAEPANETGGTLR